MRFLVTGGAGFIGSNIVEELLTLGYDVRVLDNFSTGQRENLAGFERDVDIIEGDIRDFERVQRAVEGMDVVLHQAALPSVLRSINDPITTSDINVGGTLNVLEASRRAGIKKVVYASSSSIYGNNTISPKHEHMTPSPLSPYAVSKLAGEYFCRVFSSLYDLPTISIRYFNVFGPRQNLNSQYSAVIPRFIQAMLGGQRPVIYGDGNQSRDFTYVANVVHANILAARSTCGKGLILNCACGQETTLNVLVRKIGSLLGVDANPVYSDERPGDINHSLASIDQAATTIGYVPKVGFDEGLKFTVAWFRNRLHREVKSAPEVQIDSPTHTMQKEA